MSNPYETPQWKDGTFKDNPVAGGPPMYSPGMVNQIRVVAILMMVQGSLAVLFGLFYVGMGFIFPQFFATMAEADPNFPQDDAAQLKQMSTFMLFIYVGMGLPAIIGGALQIIGGVRAYQFRNRIFAIIAVCSGFLACTTIYCGLTAIGMGIYGLIVLLNAQVATAFSMREQGHSVDKVLATFYPYRYKPQ